MPLTSSGQKILSSMQKQYGTKKGKSVFYASLNKGVIPRSKLELKGRAKKRRKQRG